jgi:hypothetical protein
MFVILVKTPKTTEKMLSVWFDIGATVPKLNSFRWKPWRASVFRMFRGQIPTHFSRYPLLLAYDTEKVGLSIRKLISYSLLMARPQKNSPTQRQVQSYQHPDADLAARPEIGAQAFSRRSCRLRLTG